MLDHHVQIAPVEVDASSVNELPGGETRAEMDHKEPAEIHVSHRGDYVEAQSEGFVMKLGLVFVATSTASERALTGVEAVMSISVAILLWCCFLLISF